MPTKSTDLPEERLFRLAAQGNKKAFGRLYERHLDEIYRYVYFRVANPLDAEDITESAFLKAWERLPEIYANGDRIRNFRAWVYRIARNLTIDFQRARKPLPLEYEPQTASGNPPAESVDRRDLSSQLVEAVQQLEPNLQQVIILRFVNQLSHEETAAIMELQPGHTRVLQYRALKKLQVILSAEEVRNE